MTGRGVIYNTLTGNIEYVIDTSYATMLLNVPEGHSFLAHQALSPNLPQTHKVVEGVLTVK